MLNGPNLPAQQLKSVAQRYRSTTLTVPSPSTWMLLNSQSKKEAFTGQEGPYLRDSRTARVEAVLLVSREPISTRKLAQLASLKDGVEARRVVRVLNQYYDESDTAFRAEEIAGGFRLLTRPQFSGWVRRVSQSVVTPRLSAPALETIAVVAYRQPVLRAEIEAIRGVGCGEILRQLMERDLVRISGRSDELGRPFLYGTTKRFLEVFGLKHLDSLPRAEIIHRGELMNDEDLADSDQQEQEEFPEDSEVSQGATEYIDETEVMVSTSDTEIELNQHDEDEEYEIDTIDDEEEEEELEEDDEDAWTELDEDDDELDDDELDDDELDDDELDDDELDDDGDEYESFEYEEVDDDDEESDELEDEEYEDEDVEGDDEEEDDEEE